MATQKQVSPEKYCSQLAAAAWKQICASHFAEGKNMGRCPQVQFKDLGDSLHGLAYPDHIELNTRRLESPDRELFLYKTTLHEVAHVAEYRIDGVMTHGPLWHALDDMIDGDGLQFTGFRPKNNMLEEVFITIIAVAVLGGMVLLGWGLITRFPVWWGYLSGAVLGGFGIVGLLAGLNEGINFLNK